ncbi:hypothetical protein OUZ56_011762 [Daphnia magna]|uniref:Uncharacterized protein n=1 Tax=Daphnia magna TaxID=35525 RepID=A0ABQ9Z176_9CRUS|nr:hypothetical protein OUZ56_011762 [Daphnia magna]
MNIPSISVPSQSRNFPRQWNQPLSHQLQILLCVAYGWIIFALQLTGPRLADFIFPPSPNKPRFYWPYSPRSVEQLPDPPTPPGDPESEPNHFIPNIADCEVKNEVGETEETPAPAEPEQPVRSL